MKKKILSLFSILLISFAFITPVNAIEIAKAGDSIVEEGDYQSLRIIAGKTITNHAKVDGITFIAGNNLTLEGSSPYAFYAGNVITIREKIEKDMFVAGNLITVDTDAIIGRDLYIAGNDVTIKTNIGRDLRIGASSVDLSNITINGDAYVDATTIIMNEKTVITGTLSYLENAKVTGLDIASIGDKKVTTSKELNAEVNYMSKVYSFIFSVISGFVAVAIIFYLIPKSLTKLNKLKIEVNDTFKSLGIGLLFLVFAPLLLLSLLITGYLSTVALFGICVYILIIYLSTFIAAYIVGKKLLDITMKDVNPYLALACGIIIVKLIKLVPYLGGICGLIIMLYGLGLICRFIISRGK